MSEFKLQQDVFARATCIPNCFIEKYMPKAAGEFVKIYIYLLKCVAENRSELSISKIADALENSEKDIIRALKYWEKKGLLKLSFEDGKLVSLRMVSFDEQAEEAEKITVNVAAGRKEEAPVKAAASADAVRSSEQASSEQASTGQSQETETSCSCKAAAPEKRQYTPEEIMRLSESDEITQLIFVIQKYLGKTLSGADLNTVLFFYDGLKLPADVIEYLFEVCVSKNHRNMRYIEKTAIGWAEDGIRTVKAAKLKNKVFSESCYPVLKAFGQGDRNPTKPEIAFVDRWSISYGFSTELILEACSRTMDTIHKPSFEYTESILRDWKSEGVTTLADVKALDTKHNQKAAAAKKAGKSAKDAVSASNSLHNFTQRTYDYSELEEKLFNT